MAAFQTPRVQRSEFGANLLRRADVGERSVEPGKVSQLHLVGLDGLPRELQGTGGAAIVGQRAREAEVSCRTNRGVHAHVGHHSSERELRRTGRTKILQERGLAEAV